MYVSQRSLIQIHILLFFFKVMKEGECCYPSHNLQTHSIKLPFVQQLQCQEAISIPNFMPFENYCLSTIISRTRKTHPTKNNKLKWNKLEWKTDKGLYGTMTDNHKAHQRRARIFRLLLNKNIKWLFICFLNITICFQWMKCISSHFHRKLCIFFLNFCFWQPLDPYWSGNRQN